jgi:phospholipase C
MARKIDQLAVSAALLFAALLAPIGVPANAHLDQGQTIHFGSATSPPAFPINHFVFVVMENHAYDNYFGTYCTKLGAYCDFATQHPLNLSRCIPLYPPSQSPCIKPFLIHSKSLSTPDLPHGWESSHAAIDNGTNDNFYIAEGSRSTPFGYYDGSRLPLYWDWAEQYGIADNWFSSVLSSSLPEHWFIFAADAPEIADNSSLGSPVADRQYLDQSNATRTVEDLLNGTSVSWKDYDWQLAPNYTGALTIAQSEKWAGILNRSAASHWNPLAARNESYQPQVSSHFVDRTTLLTDAAQGNLPNVSFVIPDANSSDHPPHDLLQGQKYVTDLLDSVEGSKEWNSTAVFVTWDDYGGFYDSVVPPTIDSLGGQQLGLSFRVPLLVISPYTPQGYDWQHLGYFESWLKLIEWRWGLPNLTARDGNAPVPLAFFDTYASPRMPLTEQDNSSQARYPQPFQSLPLPSGVSSLNVTSMNATALNVSWSPMLGGTPRDGWVIQWNLVGDNTVHKLRVDHTVESVILGGLDTSKSYVIKVRAFAGPTYSVTRKVVWSASSSSPLDPIPSNLVIARLVESSGTYSSRRLTFLARRIGNRSEPRPDRILFPCRVIRVGCPFTSHLRVRPSGSRALPWRRSSRFNLLYGAVSAGGRWPWTFEHALD